MRSQSVDVSGSFSSETQTTDVRINSSERSGKRYCRRRQIDQVLTHVNMKKIPLTLFLLFLIGTASAVDIVVPNERSYQAPYTDKVTFTLTVSSEDYNGRIIVEDQWAELYDIYAKEPTLYNKTASDLGIEISYENKFLISEGTTRDLKVTVKADTANVYCGLISFTPIDADGNDIISRGTWITMDIRGISLASANPPTNRTALNLTGFSSEKNLEIYLNRNPVGMVKTTRGNNFAVPIMLSEGGNEIFMKAVGSELRSNSIYIMLDTTHPDAPTISPPTSSSVNESTITISGTAEAASIVHIFVNGIERSSESASDSGEFTISNVNLDAGNNTITAVAVDRAGNPSNESTPVCVVCNESKKRIQLSADKTITLLRDDESATCNITTSVVDESGTLMKNITVTINFSIVSGNAVLLTGEVEAYRGGAETIVECDGAGDVTIKAETSSPGIGGDSLTITFQSPESTPSPKNETNETMPASDPEDEPKGRNIPSLLIYILVGLAIVVAGLLLYNKITKKRKRQAEDTDAGSLWMISSMTKKGEDYVITVEKGGKDKSIKLNRKLYKKLVKKRKLTFGEHTIVFKPKK